MTTPSNLDQTPRSSVSFVSAGAVIAFAVTACSIYASFASDVKDSDSYRFFPPFERRLNMYRINHLGGEYFNIAIALRNGRGYSDPFRTETGPTAWMPPIFPGILVALCWVCGGDIENVATIIAAAYVLTLIATGILMLGLVCQTNGWIGITMVFFIAAVLSSFYLSFQFTHDCWLVLGAVDLLIAGLVWGRPLQSFRWRAFGWGVFGGLAALCSPTVGFTWGVFALAAGLRRGNRSRLAIALIAAILTVSPWIIRNYLVFHRFIPVKSNLAFELYQSQCLPGDGIVQKSMAPTHPYTSRNEERMAYERLGETAYLDQKWEVVRGSIQADPAEYAYRATNRLLAATIDYVPFDPVREDSRPVRRWFSRLTFPLPFVGLVVLLMSAYWYPLARVQWIVICVYAVYLVPYVLVSYYDRYKYPLIGVDVVLSAWGIERGWRVCKGTLR